MNKQQIYDALRVALAAGGPLAALILKYTGLSQTDFEMWVSVALLIVPPAAAWVWGLLSRTDRAMVVDAASVKGVQVHVNADPHVGESVAPPAVVAAAEDPALRDVVPMSGGPVTDPAKT